MYIEQFLQKQQGKPIYQDVCYPVSQRISGKNSTRRLSLNMRKQRIRATKRRGRVPRNSMAIPIKRRTKRQHPFDN